MQSETPASTLEDKQIVNKFGVFIGKNGHLRGDYTL